MLKIFDTKCLKCDFEAEIMIDDDVLPKCEKCGGELTKLFSKMNYKLIYDPKKDLCGWAGDGYANSQYWKDVDAATERGEDVVGRGSSIYDNLESETLKKKH